MAIIKQNFTNVEKYIVENELKYFYFVVGNSVIDD